MLNSFPISILPFTILSTALVSCKKETAAMENPAPKTIQKPAGKQVTAKAPLAISAFGFPDSIEGCSCYFGEDRTAFISQNYIYTDDFQSKAFLKINGVLTEFKMDAKAQQFTKDGIHTTFKNADYEVTVEGKKVAEGEIETALYEGDITVKDQAGRSVTEKFYGECGC